MGTTGAPVRADTKDASAKLNILLGAARNFSWQIGGPSGRATLGFHSNIAHEGVEQGIDSALVLSGSRSSLIARPRKVKRSCFDVDSENAMIYGKPGRA